MTQQETGALNGISSGLQCGSIIVSKASGQSYTVSQPLGQGGFAWLCTTSSGKKCAVKVAASPAALEKEAAILKKVNEINPEFLNLQRLVEASLAENGPGALCFVAMDYMDGVSVRRMMDEAPVPINEYAARSILHEVGRAIAALHAKDVVHCGAMAASVVLDADGKAFLCDFAKSRWAGEDVRDAVPAGLLSFDDSRELDVWSFGTMMFELASMSTPREQRKYDPSMPPTPNFTADYFHKISCCLAQDPAQRAPMRVLMQCHLFDLRTPQFHRSLLKDYLSGAGNSNSNGAPANATPPTNNGTMMQMDADAAPTTNGAAMQTDAGAANGVIDGGSGLQCGSVIVSKASGQSYSVERSLGGRQGFAWLCAAASGKKCAVKVSVSPGGLETEAAILGKASEADPQFVNLQRLVEASFVQNSADPLCFVAVEFVDGVSVRKVLDEAVVPIYEFAAKYVLHDVGRAIAVLHGKNVVHCGAMAESAVLAADGRAFLCDFAKSRWAEEEMGDVSSAELGSFEVVDSRSADLWSFGTMAFELSQGHVPREQRSAYDPNVPPTTKGFTEEYFRLVACCLAQDPRQRMPMRQLLQCHVLDLRCPHLNRGDLSKVLSHPDNRCLYSQP